MKEREYIFMKSEDKFEPGAFKNPDIVYAPVYVWCWNAEVTEEETINQLEEMERLGIKAMYILPEPKSFRPASIPTRLEPDYLTTPYFEAFAFATRQAAKKGMNMWLYDEGGWPSGGACGKVLLEHPEYAKCNLASREKAYRKDQIYEMSDDTLAAFLENGNRIENGFVFPEDHVVSEYYINTDFFRKPSVPDFPDLTRKEATEAFINMGLEPYLQYLSDYFGESITGVFMDEPTMPRPVPFRQELVAEFERRYGYSILPYLPDILGKNSNRKGAMARIDWFDMCSEIFCENFLLTEKKWANDKGVPYLGHLDGDDKAYSCLKGGHFHILRALRCLDVPGVDVIWRQIFPVETPTPFNDITGVTGENRIFPRYASSAAAQIGSKRALTESLGVYGAGVDFDEMRFVMNFQAVRGINVFNLFTVPYGRSGFLMTGEMPFFTEKHACYADLAPFNEYLERLSYVASIGTMKNNVGLYMPMNDIWAGEKSEFYCEQFEKTGKDLEDAGIPFDILDDDVLKYADAAALSHGEIRMGYACYNTLIIPPFKYMPQKSQKVMEEFVKGGGKVYMVSGQNQDDVRGAEFVESLQEVLKPPIEITGDKRLLRIGVREYDGGKLFFIHNERETDAAFGVMPTEQPYLLDLNTGKILNPRIENGEIRLNLVSGEMAVILCTNKSLPAGDIQVFEHEKKILESFTFRRTKQFIIGDMEYITQDIIEEPAEISLGDWSYKVGRSYSGSGIYSVTFSVPKRDGLVCLDLGEVHYTCEVFLNGKSLGVRVMAPYTYEIDAASLNRENRLDIRVTNTGANAYVYTTSFDKWQEWQLPYMPKQRIFHKDSLSGGLYGPVKIFY